MFLSTDNFIISLYIEYLSCCLSLVYIGSCMKNKGFTLIELVVVIVILGILSATALPKFINISQDAHDSIAKSLKGSFKSAVSMYHSCWLASGEQDIVYDLACFGEGNIDSTPEGYPLGDDTLAGSSGGTVLTGDYCRQIWIGLLDANDFQLAIHTDASFGGDNDIIYWYSNPDATLPSTYCYYNYIADNAAKGQENWQIRYFPATGDVSLGRATLG